MIAIQEQLVAWIPKVQGQYINMDWNPTNQGFGAQCWDLAAHWSSTLGLPIIHTGGAGRWPGWAGNMVDAFPQTPAIAAAYELVSPDAPGLPGDIAVWGDSYKEYYPATHVAVLIKDNGSLLFCGSQNSTAALATNPYPQWSSGPATIQNLPRKGLIGFIRPRLGGIQLQSTTTTTAGDDEEMLSPEAQAYLEKTFLTKADGGTIRADLEWQNGRLLNKQDGGYANNMRDAQHAAVMEALGKTLNKEDGGYIVGLIEATRTTDPDAVAAALVGLIPAEIADQVAAKFAEKLGAQA